MLVKPEQTRTKRTGLDQRDNGLRQLHQSPSGAAARAVYSGGGSGDGVSERGRVPCVHRRGHQGARVQVRVSMSTRQTGSKTIALRA